MLRMPSPGLAAVDLASQQRFVCDGFWLCEGAYETKIRGRELSKSRHMVM